MDIRENMGMFDTVRSSYDLGEEFTDVVLQTKDFNWHGGNLDFYWIDPAGRLWKQDLNGVAEPEMNNETFWITWKPTGKKGKIRRFYLTDSIRVYPADYHGPWEEWPEIRITFHCGEVKATERITKETTNTNRTT
jgi:hypothetical protein